MALPMACKAAVFEGPNQPLRLRQFEIPHDLPQGAALCRVRFSTICGSDLHTVQGRRVEPTPSILGHESVGDVVAVGEGAAFWNGAPLTVGERVSWTIMASCSDCFYCRSELPQKCVELRKYGHNSTDVWPGLTGGYAEYIYLYPGTGIFPAPPDVADEVIAPANCALATVACARDAIGGIAPGESVLILGAGMLGLYLAALVKEAGASPVLVTDTNAARAERARRFGADMVCSESAAPADVAKWVRDACGTRGVDVAFEVCGNPRAAETAIESLRVGGRLLIAGMVTPDSRFSLDGNVLTRKCLTLRGIHNYRPEHLATGLEFLASTADTYPYKELVGEVFGLNEIEQAFAAALEGKSVRVGVRCSDAAARR